MNQQPGKDQRMEDRRRVMAERGPVSILSYAVYGGEVDDPSLPLPNDGAHVTPKLFRAGTFDVIGVCNSYQEAYDIWKAQAWKTVDNAHARYRIAVLSHELLRPPASPDMGFLKGTIVEKVKALLEGRA